MKHIAIRFFFHVALSLVFVLFGYYGIKYLAGRSPEVAFWLGETLGQQLIIAGLMTASMGSLREPYDIWKGNNDFTKACFDQASWFVGAGLSVWFLYKIW